MNEAAVRLLDTQRDVSNRRSFVASNRQRAEGQGLKESDTPRPIAESRAERRR